MVWFGLWSTYLLRPLLSTRGLERLRLRAGIVLVLLTIGLLKADQLTLLAEESVLGGAIIHSTQSPFQRIAITRKGKGFQLFLNGHLQFNSTDEYATTRHWFILPCLRQSAHKKS